MKKKILLITIHNANNYGAVFQAFGLQKVLENFGEVKILDYENKHISISFQLLRIKLTPHGILGLGKDFFRLFPRYRVIKKFKTFIRKNYNLTSKFDRKNSFDFDQYDVLVSGSDQIWNPACISPDSKLDSNYLLSFGSEKHIRLSYSSSMGAYQFNHKEESELRHYLSNFNFISVREYERKLYLQNLLKREDIYHVIDPSLLLTKEEYISLVENENEKVQSEIEKYILLYTVPKVNLIRKAVAYYRSKMGLKVVSIEQGLSPGAKVDKHIMDAGPLEFIELFRNAEFVITDSFHGTCFSLNFGKKFVSVSPGKNVNRIESILNKMGLKDRILYTEDDFEKVDNSLEKDVDSKLLDSLRRESLKFLEKSLN